MKDLGAAAVSRLTWSLPSFLLWRGDASKGPAEERQLERKGSRARTLRYSIPFCSAAFSRSPAQSNICLDLTEKLLSFYQKTPFLSRSPDSSENTEKPLKTR